MNEREGWVGELVSFMWSLGEDVFRAGVYFLPKGKHLPFLALEEAHGYFS
jgi:hypothetical protein